MIYLTITLRTVPSLRRMMFRPRWGVPEPVYESDGYTVKITLLEEHYAKSITKG